MISSKNILAVLDIAIKNNSPTTPLTLGYLSNILKMAEKFEERDAKLEEKQHKDILEEISYFSQN